MDIINVFNKPVADLGVPDVGISTWNNLKNNKKKKSFFWNKFQLTTMAGISIPYVILQAAILL